jgi:uroporphyrinogen-III synthase
LETVVITASAGAFPGLSEALSSLPVTVEEQPLVQFRPPVAWTELDAALSGLSNYGALAFTSPRAAGAVLARIRDTTTILPTASMRPVIWASGPATAAVLEGVLAPVLIPSSQEVGRHGAGAALARAMIAAGVAGPVLYPCGEVRREELPVELRSRGLRVDEVVCYRSVLADESLARAAAARATVIVVASPRVAQLLARACHETDRPDLLAVGPTTAAAAQASGWMPGAVADEPSMDAIAGAVRTLLVSRQRR